MKSRLNHLITSLCMFLLLGSQHVSAATSAELEALFNGAESIYPQFFPDHQITQKISPWTFRFYPTTGIYVGEKDNEIFVLGGVFGDNAVFIDTAPNLIAKIVSSGGNTGVPNCDTSNIPEGMVVTQNGNVVNVTTNDQCIKIPLEEGNNFCETPASTVATGISALSQTEVTEFEAKGITISLPGVSNPLDSVADNLDDAHCIIDTPEQVMSQVVHIDVCMDLTDLFPSLSTPSSPPPLGFIVEPPVTMKYKATSTTQVVSDCFATDAATISNAVTGENWVRGLGGDFVKIN